MRIVPNTLEGYWLKYHWVEDDRDEMLIVTDLREKEFEELLVKGITVVNSYGEVEYNDEGVIPADEKITFSVRCVPEAWEKLIAYLEDNGCQTVSVAYQHYEIDDHWGDSIKPQFTVERVEKRCPERINLLNPENK